MSDDKLYLRIPLFVTVMVLGGVMMAEGHWPLGSSQLLFGALALGLCIYRLQHPRKLLAEHSS
jgi:hypothetical protein